MDKVSHVQFVEDLAAKLGLTEEETVKKLTELILSIKMESESGKMIIDGLGMFTTKGKILTFIPDESFELEINHNYAGMMPVEIEEPKPGTPASSAKPPKEDDNTDESDAVTDDFEEEEFVDVIEEQDPFDLDDDEAGTESTSTSKNTGEKGGEITSDAAEKARKAALEAEEQKIKEEEDAVRKAELEAQKEEKKNKEVAAASAAAALAARKAGESEKAQAEAEKVKALEKEAAEKKKAEAKERAEAASEKSADELSGGGAANEEEIRPEWVEPEAETAQEVRSDGKKPAIKEIPAYDRARPDSNTGTIIAILVAAVVVVAGALYLFGFLSGSEPATTTSPVISEQTEVPPATSDIPEIEETETGISATDQLAQEEAARDVTSQPAPAVEDQPAAPAETQQTPAQVRETTAPAASYGLRGTMNTTMARPYTIVVHSLASRADAEREAATVAEAGYRSTWFRVELPNGSVRWRVSIGQFASSDAAVEAARQLPEPYSANNFISRIESYNP
jgi:hypothetical protein